MSPKIRPEHLSRLAIVYVRQSSLGQVEHNTESQRRQNALAETAGEWSRLRHALNRLRRALVAGC